MALATQRDIFARFHERACPAKFLNKHFWQVFIKCAVETRRGVRAQFFFFFIFLPQSPKHFLTKNPQKPPKIGVETGVNILPIFLRCSHFFKVGYMLWGFWGFWGYFSSFLEEFQSPPLFLVFFLVFEKTQK